jgi:hypothetical protein
MTPVDLADVRGYIEDNIGAFHDARLASLRTLNLRTILGRKNPYLFRVKATASVDQLLDDLLTAHMSSSEETILGNWLEGLAIFINERTFGGHKSNAPGIDLEFDRDDIHWIVAIKSGPNWGNSSQIEKLKSIFDLAKKRFHTSGHKGRLECVNGCCYGRDDAYRTGGYYKYSGQRFWEFISGSATLYTDLVVALGHMAKESDEVFRVGYVEARSRLFGELATIGIANEDGTINWPGFAEITSKTGRTRKQQLGFALSLEELDL